ncbi:trimethylamine methyltransferase family protein [Haloarculaceae archaeon H-GB2-1]|nr:trimethylamine methyltransferase family protein [Haloarculaceae archaeon H-GB2-1]
MRYIEKYIEGYDLDEESFAMDLIEEIDPGGHFLNKKHTLTNSKDFIRPELYFRDSYDNWTDQGSKDAFESARDRVDDMLDSYERPPSTRTSSATSRPTWRTSARPSWSESAGDSDPGRGSSLTGQRVGRPE